MKYSRFARRVSKICALTAGVAALQVFAYAGIDNGQGNNGQNNGKQNGHHKVPPAVPETNAGWVLVELQFSSTASAEPQPNSSGKDQSLWHQTVFKD